MRLLVISRKYPPSIGGMQEFASQFIRHLGEEDTVYPIAREVPRLLLPCFFISVIIQGWLMRKTVQAIHLCDGALAPLGLILKVVTRRPAAITLFGLDLVYRNGLYQRIIPLSQAVGPGDLHQRRHQVRVRETRGERGPPVRHSGRDLR